MKLFAKDTGDLFVELKEEKNLQNYLHRNENEFLIPLHEYLKNLLTEKNLNLNDVVNACDLNRVYAYQIFNGTKKKSVTRKNFGNRFRDGFKFRRNAKFTKKFAAKFIVPAKYLGFGDNFRS